VFPPLHTLDEVFIPPTVLQRSNTPSLDHLSSIEEFNTERRETMRTVFHLLRRVIHSQESFAVSAGSIRIMMLYVENYILHQLFAEVRDDQDADLHAAQRISTLLFAAHLFLYVVLREVPTTSHLAQTLTTRLQIALGSAQADGAIWSGFEHALLWAAFIGMVGVGRPGEQRWQWFSGVFKETVSIIEAKEALPKSTADVRRILEMFLWRDRHCSSTLEEWSYAHLTPASADLSGS